MTLVSFCLTLLISFTIATSSALADLGAVYDTEVQSSQRINLDLTQASIRGQSASAVASNFSHIVIDVRGTRGGKGDVAAGYLTALDFIFRLKFQGQITLIVDDPSKSILSKLTGRKIEADSKLYAGKIQFEQPGLLRPMKPADLYLSLANPSGTPKDPSTFDIIPKDGLSSSPTKIPIHDQTIKITQTVLGNTENRNSKNPKGLIQAGSYFFNMDPAGLAKHESGIYFDAVALRLRGKPKNAIRAFVKASIGHTQGPTGSTLSGILDNRLLADSTVGLVYGITAEEVKHQFERYLSGLSSAAQSMGKSYTLLTPSGFSLSDIKNDLSLRDRVVVLESSSSESIPKKAKPGTIYVVKTGALPHRTFVGLMAYSEIPPVVAGDGAMSAAAALGKPFLMTEVAWNKRNIQELATHLRGDGSHSPEAKAGVQKISDKELDVVLDLKPLEPAFESVLEKVKPLSDEMLFAAVEAKRVATAIETGSVPVALILKIPEENLRWDLLISAWKHGRSDARDVLIDLVKNEPAILARLLPRMKEEAPSFMLLPEIQALARTHLIKDLYPRTRIEGIKIIRQTDTKAAESLAINELERFTIYPGSEAPDFSSHDLVNFLTTGENATSATREAVLKKGLTHENPTVVRWSVDYLGRVAPYLTPTELSDSICRINAYLGDNVPFENIVDFYHKTILPSKLDERVMRVFLKKGGRQIVLWTMDSLYRHARFVGTNPKLVRDLMLLGISRMSTEDIHTILSLHSIFAPELHEYIDVARYVIRRGGKEVLRMARSDLKFTLDRIEHEKLPLDFLEYNTLWQACSISNDRGRANFLREYRAISQPPPSAGLHGGKKCLDKHLMEL